MTSSPFVIVFAFAFGCGASAGGGAGSGATTLADKLAAANRAQQPLVAEFGATWCKPCHDFADHVLTDPRVHTALAGVVFVQYDIDTAAGADAAKRCNVSGVPAVVGVARDGTPQPLAAGREPTVDEFIAFLEHAKAAPPAP
jgi:thiol:disulfide interchange protein